MNFKSASGLNQKVNLHSNRKCSRIPPTSNLTNYRITQNKWNLDKHKNLLTTLTVSHAVGTYYHFLHTQLHFQATKL